MATLQPEMSLEQQLAATIAMSIYTDYFYGRISLTDHLVEKGYGQSGGVCAKCHKPLKRFPIYNGDRCLKCYLPGIGATEGGANHPILALASTCTKVYNVDHE